MKKCRKTLLNTVNWKFKKIIPFNSCLFSMDKKKMLQKKTQNQCYVVCLKIKKLLNKTTDRNINIDIKKQQSFVYTSFSFIHSFNQTNILTKKFQTVSIHPFIHPSINFSTLNSRNTINHSIHSIYWIFSLFSRKQKRKDFPAIEVHHHRISTHYTLTSFFCVCLSNDRNWQIQPWLVKNDDDT